MNDLMIGDIDIRQDAHGRFSLNDLYRASGSANRKRPSLWLANRDTQDLIAALERRIAARSRCSSPASIRPNMVLFSPGWPGSSEQEFLLRNPATEQEYLLAPVATEASGNPGSYVVRELVYAYAMWISPDFHIDVIEAYDALMTGRLDWYSLTQAERYWFGRFPHWRVIRDRVLGGDAYRSIAAALSRSAASIARAVRRMIAVGLMHPRAVAIAQREHPAASRAARQLIPGWGQQLALDL